MAVCRGERMRGNDRSVVCKTLPNLYITYCQCLAKDYIVKAVRLVSWEAEKLEGQKAIKL
jgi:hypothetical protein